MKKILVFVFFTFSCQLIFGQDTAHLKRNKKEERRKRINAIAKQEEEGVIKYKTHVAGGLKLTTDGSGVFAEMGVAKSVEKALLFQIEITERKHAKEEKLQYELYPPFIYGKINYFYPVKLGVQKQIILGNKGNKNGVGLTANFGGGVSLGLLRPYMIQVEKGNNSPEFVEYNSPDSIYFTDLNSIYGGPSFNNGWNKLKLTPGLYAKSGVRFDYGKYNELLSGIEIGATAEFYNNKIAQMINIKQRQYFIGAYVSVIFGRRK